MRRGIACFALLVLLPACSSSGGSPSQPNPVSLIDKATGCRLDNGAPSGSPGFGGAFLVADCTYPTQEQLTVKTFKSDKDRDADIAVGGNPDGTITGPQWVAYVTAAAGNAPDPSVASIAQQLGGQAR